MRLSIVAAIVSMAALSACQSTEEFQDSVAAAQPASSSVKTAIVEQAKDWLVDPYSVRDAEISYLQLNKRSGNQWLCVKANAKNRMGGYTGRQAVEVVVRDGRLIGNQLNSPACSSPSLRWQPFPELERGA